MFTAQSREGGFSELAYLLVLVLELVGLLQVGLLVGICQVVPLLPEFLSHISDAQSGVYRLDLWPVVRAEDEEARAKRGGG